MGKGGELKKFLKNIIKEKFKCMNKKPNWLQSPNWPIIEGVPLVFIDQIDITTLTNNKSMLYVFFDEKNKNFITVTQHV